MSTEQRCSCCDLPVYSCGSSRERQQRVQQDAERRRLLDQPGVIGANWPGACSSCGERFVEGDPIRRTADGWRALTCCGEGAR